MEDMAIELGATDALALIDDKLNAHMAEHPSFNPSALGLPSFTNQTTLGRAMGRQVSNY